MGLLRVEMKHWANKLLLAKLIKPIIFFPNDPKPR